MWRRIALSPIDRRQIGRCQCISVFHRRSSRPVTRRTTNCHALRIGVQTSSSRWPRSTINDRFGTQWATAGVGCPWRIVISPIIPYNSPSCYHSSMRPFLVLFIHLIAILTQLFQPGGVRSLVAESLLLKHQLLIVNRSRQRSPTLSSWDRILAGWMALLIRPTRLLRSAIVLKPSTLLALHKAMSKRKYRMLFSTNRRRKPGPKGPSAELIHCGRRNEAT